MGLYAKFVLPRLIELAMKNKEMTRLREVSIPKARGEVLEVGIGSGLNLPFYSDDVQRIYGVDPSSELQRLARPRAAARRLPIEFLRQTAEEALPLKAASIDCAVVTWTLCSIPNIPGALQEVRRVLKPGGMLIFIEHGRTLDADVAVWQNRLTPIWKRVAGGCHLNRPIKEMINDAGFLISELQTSYLTGPRPMTYTYQGVAVAPSQGVIGSMRD